MTPLVTVVGTGAEPPLIGALSVALRASFGPADSLGHALICCTLTYLPCIVLMWPAGRAIATKSED